MTPAPMTMAGVAAGWPAVELVTLGSFTVAA
jgi:hypothetical protein